MKWGLVSKPQMAKAVSIAQDIREVLEDAGDEVFAENDLARAAGMKGNSFKEINKLVDIVITVGGDGTILLALEDIDKPIFAINSGGMGFLSEVESKYAMGGIRKLLEGEYNVEERAKLKIMLDGKRLPDAANELTVQNARIAKILYLQILVDGELIETMGADGIIIATPTGSTSYSLSVGGPIMDPSVNAMIIAPIAPFKLSARPWIVPLTKTIQIKLLKKSKESKLVIDGRIEKSVTPDSDIQITVSDKKARFIRFGESFYQMVRLKLVR